MLLRVSDYGILINVLKHAEHLPYVIIRGNSYDPGQFSVVAIVTGESKAQLAVDRFDRKLTDEEREAGWRHHLRRTTLPLDSDLEDATEIMKADWHSMSRKK